MYIRILLAIALLLILFVALRWFFRAPPQIVARRIKRSVLYGVIILLIFLALSGRLHWIFGLLAAIFPIIMRMLPLLRYVPFLRQLYMRYQQRRAGQTAGQGRGDSAVTTKYLQMSLDHAHGEISGKVLEGPYKGYALSDLTLPQLVQLYHYYMTEDTDSARLIENYASRIHGEKWSSAHQQPPTTSTAMTRAEAYAILGLAQDASRDEIIAAHRRLMQKVHPDHGGSDYLASQINLAKELLLKDPDAS